MPPRPKRRGHERIWVFQGPPEATAGVPETERKKTIQAPTIPTGQAENVLMGSIPLRISTPLPAQPSHFAFVSHNEKSSGKKGDDAIDRKLIRMHVMREFRRKQRSGKKQGQQLAKTMVPLSDFYHCKQGSTVTFPPVFKKSLSSSERSQWIPCLGPTCPFCATWMSSSGSRTPSMSEYFSNILFTESLKSSTSTSSRPDFIELDFPPPQSLLGAGYTDPFQTGSVKLDSRMHGYFHYFGTVFCVDIYPFDPKNLRSLWWSAAWQEPAMLLGIMWTAAAYQAAKAGYEPNIDGLLEAQKMGYKPAVDCVKYKIQAWKAIHETIMDPTRALQDDFITTIAFLRGVECFGGDVDSIRVHNQGLIRLVELRGGLDNLPHLTVSKIFTGDIKTSVLTSEKPVFMINDVWRRETHNAYLLDLERVRSVCPRGHGMECLATGFLRKHISIHLHSDLLKILNDLRTLVLYTEDCKSSNELNALQDGPYANDPYIEIEHRIISFYFDNCYQTDDHMQECFCLALLLFSNMTFWGGLFLTVTFLRSQSRLLKESLLRLELNFPRQSYPELFFWMFFMGALTAEETEKMWFVRQLASVGKYLGLYEWTDVETLLSNFFYVDRVFKASFSRLWSGEVQAEMKQLLD
ncbi:MAG: hypothetical protein M1834_001368 [Cirrosporium novae-zelandiae]|nr:MAG: hypothetical protein M1834_001368 [Cirrosporium novae-zelandiae]